MASIKTIVFQHMEQPLEDEPDIGFYFFNIELHTLFFYMKELS